MRLTVFQKIGLVGIGLLVVGFTFGFILSASGLGMPLFALGGILVMVGILGGIVLAIYQAGAKRERRRLGLPPSGP